MAGPSFSERALDDAVEAYCARRDDLIAISRPHVESPKIVDVFHYAGFDAVRGLCAGPEPRLRAGNNSYFADGREILYYAGMCVGAIRHCPDFTDAERLKAERWTRDFIARKLPFKVYVASFSLVPDGLALWRAYAPRDGCALGFPMRPLKALVDEKTSFIGRTFYDVRDHEAKVVDKVKRILAELPEFSEESRANAEALLERRFHKPLAKLSAFQRHPALFEEQEFRLAFLSPPKDAIRPPERAGGAPYIEVPLGPALGASKKVLFSSIRFGPSRLPVAERRQAIEALLAGAGVTCGDWSESATPWPGS